MAMRRDIRWELGKLRELVAHLLEGRNCYFCQKPLLANTEATTFGSGRGRPVKDWITIHHINGDHDDNRRENRAEAHDACHRAFHLAVRRANAAG